MNLIQRIALSSSLFALATTSVVHAQIFNDDFDTAGSAASWNVQADVDTSIDFGWDYSNLGIPAAPNGSGTTGVRMAANISAGAAAGLSMTPVGVTLPSNYTISFDMWINANGPFPAGGSGSTEFSTFGVGTSGNQVQWNTDGQVLGVSGEGGSSFDYRLYDNGSLVAGGSGVYAAETVVDPEGDDPRNQFHIYYETAFPGQEPPAAQTALYPDQNGAVRDGSLAFAWREVEIRVMGGTAEWYIDSVLIATNTFDGTGSPFIGYYDAFSSVSGDADNSFGVYDNFQVIPEPSTYAAIFGGLALLGAFSWRRRARK